MKDINKMEKVLIGPVISQVEFEIFLHQARLALVEDHECSESRAARMVESIKTRCKAVFKITKGGASHKDPGSTPGV